MTNVSNAVKCSANDIFFSLELGLVHVSHLCVKVTVCTPPGYNPGSGCGYFCEGDEYLTFFFFLEE